MDRESKTLVWNRAALNSGGAKPREGDRALADALKVHSLVMNGGVHHAVEVIGVAGVHAAVAGFEYFGLVAVGEVLRDVLHSPLLREWNDDTEAEANRRYAEILPDDGALVVQFERAFLSQPGDFAAVL